MKYLNQFHKEAMERTIRKIRDAEKDPMSPRDFVAYMWRNYRMALEMEKEGELNRFE
jgi:hypothetical protein